MLVNATTILENKKSVSSNTNYYGYGGYYRPYAWGPGFSGTTTYNVYDYKDGSLIIDIVAASNKQLLWQGTGNKEIDKPSKDPDHDIAEVVAKILSNFPPAAKNKFSNCGSLFARQSGLLNRLPVQRGNTTTGTYIASTWPGLLHRPHAATRANVVLPVSCMLP